MANHSIETANPLIYIEVYIYIYKFKIINIYSDSLELSKNSYRIESYRIVSYRIV